MNAFFFKTTKLLRDKGFNCITIQELGLNGTTDDKVIEQALNKRAVLITIDKDFANIYQYPPGDYYGIIVLKMKSELDYIDKVHDRFFLLLEELTDFKGKLFVVDDKKYRIRSSLYRAEGGS